MTDHVDEILELIDGGLQRSSEPSYGPIDRSKCWRCSFHPAELDASAGLCSGCRAFLLDEGPDPKLSLPLGAIFSEADLEAIAAAIGALVEAIRPALEWLADRLSGIVADLVEVFAGLVKLFDRPPDRGRIPPLPRNLRALPPLPDLRATEAPRRPPIIRRRS